MELSLSMILKVVSELGILGLVIIMWWTDMKNIRTILNQYKDDMKEMRQMYANNASLVKKYENLAGDLKDVIVMSTQSLTQMGDKISSNQYCPAVRLEKEAKGVQG